MSPDRRWTVVGRHSTAVAAPESPGPSVHDFGHVDLGHDFSRLPVHAVVRPSGSGGSQLQRQEAPKKEEPKEEEPPDQFPYKPGLDAELRKRFNRMVFALKTRGIAYGLHDDVRPSKRAHLVSTGYHIHTRPVVSLAALQALTDGKDEDGTTWYQKSWETVPTWGGYGDPRAATSGEIMARAREYAFYRVKAEGAGFVNEPTWSANTVNCAYEGYEPSSPKRKPNGTGVPISNHVIGTAIDLNGIDWAKLGGSWSSEANAFIAEFGLSRPYVPGGTTYCIEEPWHFEIGPAPAKKKEPAPAPQAPKK